jgi:hypothetical protein
VLITPSAPSGGTKAAGRPAGPAVTVRSQDFFEDSPVAMPAPVQPSTRP